MNQPNTTSGGRLACAFGISWLHHFEPPIGSGKGCLLCAADTMEACAEFDAAVARGEYDAEGYTPAERRAQVKRRSAA